MTEEDGVGLGLPLDKLPSYLLHPLLHPLLLHLSYSVFACFGGKSKVSRG